MANSELNEAPSLWLKGATRDEHKATEATALAQKMATGGLTLSHYACMLAAYEALHNQVEYAAVTNGLAHFLGNPTKSALARTDMAVLGVELAGLPAALVTALADVSPAHEPSESPHEVLGRLYVMEGSALGAAILLPVIERTLSLSTATRYFRGHGRETMPHWAAFRRSLDVHLDTPEHREQARRGAVIQFAAVRTLFEVIDAHAASTQLVGMRASG